MKKLILIIALIWVSISQGQTANGTETKQNAFRSLNPQTVVSPTFVTSMGSDGTMGKASVNNMPVSIPVQDSLNKKINLPTGFLQGLQLSINADPTKFNIAPGYYVVTDFTNLSAPYVKIVTYAGATGLTPAYLASANSTYVALDINGNVVSSASPFTNEDRRTLAIIGNVVHSNHTTINVTNEIKAPIVATTNQLHDFMKAIGFLNEEGNIYSPNGANLMINKSAGKIFGMGINSADYLNPHQLTIASQTALTFAYRLRGGTQYANTQNIDPNNYDNGGALTSVPVGSRWTIQRINLFQSGLARVQYGQEIYTSYNDAVTALPIQSFVTEQNISDNAVFRCYLIVKQGTTDLAGAVAAGNALFVPVDKFGNVIGNGSVALTYSNIVAALGYTPENLANKQNSLATDGTGVKFPTVDAISGGTAYKRTIAQIRSLSGTLPNTNFYTTDLGQEGNWYYDASDTTSADNTGTILVTSDGKRIKRIVYGPVNVKWFGAISNGIFDNTSIINNALSTYKEVYFPDGDYLVTSLVNNLGAKLTGSGVIRKAITGGTQQLNTGIDRYNYIVGQEYLSFVQNKIINRGGDNGVNIKVSWSGDSTTAGDGITSGFTLSELFREATLVSGISNVTSLNRGHSGANTEQWRTTYLADDLAENPDLYIIRWGINDPGWLKNGTAAPIDSGDTYPNRRDIGDFTTSLRTALTTIRSSKTQAQMSIILMSPNPTSDTPNARDEKWYEQVRKVYLQAARDFKCAFIDTYGLWLDSRGAADIYMDNPFADGRAIHPKNVYNTWIVSKVSDLVFPENFKVKTASGRLINESSVDRFPLKTDLPETYRKGISLNRTATATWSVDGTATTVFNTDGAGYQFNTSRSTTTPRIFFRTFMNDYLVTPLAWSNEVEMWHSGNLTNPVTGTGSTNFLSKWAGASTQVNSQIFDNGSNVSIGGASPPSTARLYVKSNATAVFPLILDNRNSTTNGKWNIFVDTGAVDDSKLGIKNNATSKGIVIEPISGNLQIDGLIGTGTRPVIVDSSGNLSTTVGYKVYVALLTQTGTSAPVATVLDNTLGGTVVWTRNSAGNYIATLTAAFTNNKTAVFVTNGITANMISLSAARGNDNTVNLNAFNTTNVGVDDRVTNASFEVRVYN